MRNHPIWMILLILGLSPNLFQAQSWVEIDPETIHPTGARDIIPQTCKVYRIDYQAMKSLLWASPHEYAVDPSESNTIITVGLADGSADMFRVVHYDMMEAPLAAQYPDIKTFRGVSISNPYRTIRIDWTKEGFRAVIAQPGGRMFIDPYQRNDLLHRVVYYINTYSRLIDWDCGVEQEDFHNEETPLDRNVGDCEFRSYRLAVATTGEYSNFFGATSPAQSALILSQVVTAVNRVNDVYEADLTVRLILIGNTDDVFYYDPGGDPYSGSACTQLGQNQTTITTVIGSANYDVGHVFSVGSGGCAGLGVICNNASKARGATGLNPPTGDPFYIDYVAHEIGHQFGGNHTFNGTAGSCSGNRVAAAAYEPGSGSTIMAYAGICGAQNLQPNSDDYFHAKSLAEISNVLASTSCDILIPFTNTAPVANNVTNYNIPISTPFVLTASVTDDEDDPLTYCWEEYDLETTSTEPPTSGDVDGPMFRSFDPVTIPQRYFPRLVDLTQNINPAWEVLPSATRTMTFKMTVRDYHEIAGCTDEDDVIISTNANAGPFLVTSQNSPTVWLEGTNDTITWNVANTTASPVSCTNVDIYLSTDGGMTYPTSLSLNEPNDGSAIVSIPAGITTMGRVMVRGANNIFFDINNTNITINPGLPNFTLMLDPVSVAECNDGSVQTIVEVGQFMGFTDPVTLSILNLPPGATAMFDPVVVIPGSNSTLTFSNLTGLFGMYTPMVRGTSTTGDKDAIFSINLLSTPAMGPTLTSPANNAINAVITPLLDWQIMTGVIQYEYQLAYDNMFANMVLSGVALLDQYQITSPLIVGQQYFWRVRAYNSCGNGPWSTVFSFTTISCFALTSPNVPIIIPASGTSTVTSTFNSLIDMTITDVNIYSLMGTHSWMDDLQFTLIAPDGTEQLFWNRPCMDHDNFNINFDDEAPGGNWPCPPTNGLTYRPDDPLTIFDTHHSEGIWTMEVTDLFDQDGGSLNAWGIRVCGDLACQLVVNQTSGSGSGSLPAAINCAVSGDTVLLSAALSGQTINIGGMPLTINTDIVILAEGSNINITGSGDRVFEVGSTADVEFSGMMITAGTSMTAGAINNPGMVTLKNVIVEKNPGVNGATLIQNTSGAQLEVIGACLINE